MEAVTSSDAPKPVGPYSQAILAGQYLFCSGQVGLDPATGELVPGGIAEQTRKALENLTAVLDAAGLTFGDVVKCTVFLAAMSDFAAMNEVYSGFIEDPAPARSTVAVKELPKGALVEIEAVARAG